MAVFWAGNSVHPQIQKTISQGRQGIVIGTGGAVQGPVHQQQKLSSEPKRIPLYKYTLVHALLKEPCKKLFVIQTQSLEGL